MQRRKHEVSGFRGSQRKADRFQIAHFTDQNVVGVFTERGAKRIRKR